MAVFKKIAKVIAQTKAITKEGRNEAQKYDYVRWKETAEAVRKVAIDNGLAISTSVISEEHSISTETDKYGTEKTVLWSFVTLRLDITDTDSAPGDPDTYSIVSHGSAKDYGDKSVYKATTGALKYALRQAFMLPDTDDDPEGDESIDKPVSNPEAKAESKPRFTAPASNQQPKPASNSKVVEFVPAAKLHELIKLAKYCNPDADQEQAKQIVIEAAERHGIKKITAITQAQFVAIEDELKQAKIS